MEKKESNEVSTILVSCPACKRKFPVNPKKHLYDREVRCPRCKTPIKIRTRLGKFNPNAKWAEQKEESRFQRLRLRTRRKRRENKLGINEQVAAAEVFASAIASAVVLQQHEKSQKQ